MFVQTVASNKTFLTSNEVKDADKALYYQELMGWPSMSALCSYIKNNLITNCDITIDDITRSEQIYGKAVPELKGKMKRSCPLSHLNVQQQPLPSPLKGKNLHLYIDVFFVYKIAFFVSKTKGID